MNLFTNNIHKKFFFQVLDILDKQQIEYCLFAGTLLGAIRDNSFLPNDHKDTDIALDDKYYWQIRAIFNKLVLNKIMKWNGIWRKELSVMSLDNKIKVDMFFMEKKEDKYAVYSYKPNKKDGKWDYEWQMLFSFDAFFPTIDYTFYGRTVKIPNNYKIILQEQYNNWQIPDKNFISSDVNCYNANKNYEGFSPAGIINIKDYKINIKNYDIGYICTTIKRPDAVKKTINSIQLYCPNIKIYIADQNPPNAKMLKFYEDHNIEYYFTEFNSGLSWNRNFLVKKVREPYIFIGDDDFTFTEQTKVDIFKEILKERKDIGIVGGALINSSRYNKRIVYDINRKSIYLVQLKEKEYKTKNNYKYILTDLVLNFFLAKKEIFKQIQWDNELKLAEHLDFFMRFKSIKWKVAYTSEVKAIHDRNLNDDYKKMRFGQSKEFYNKFLKKYGLPNKNYVIALEDNFTADYLKIIPEFIEKNKTIVSEKSDLKNINCSPIDYILKDFVNILIELKKSAYLSKYTCLQAVVNHTLNGNIIYLSTNKLSDKDKKILDNCGYIYSLQYKAFVKDNYQIILDYNIPHKYKTINIARQKFNIPLPVTTYLSKLYGITWRNYGKK